MKEFCSQTASKASGGIAKDGPHLVRALCLDEAGRRR
jgi:hypothetical protein